MVAEVPPVPAPTTTHCGTGAGSQFELPEQALGDVVVTAPVGRPLGKSELVHEMPVDLAGQSLAFLTDHAGVVHVMAGTTIELNLRAFLPRGLPRHDGDEGQFQQLCKIGLRDGRTARGGFDNRGALRYPTIAQAIQEQRAGQPMLEAATGMRGFIFKIDGNPLRSRQHQPHHVRVGTALEICGDLGYRPFDPCSHVILDAQG